MNAPAVIIDFTDTQKAQARLDGLRHSSGRGTSTVFPESWEGLRIRKTLRVPPGLWGGRMEGQSMQWPHFVADFPDDTPPEHRVLFDLRNVRNFRAGHFFVRVEPRTHLEAVAVHRQLADRPGNSLMTNPHWYSIQVEAPNGATLQHGFIHTARNAPDGAAAVNANDEHARYTDINLFNVRASAVVLGHSQCKEVVLDGVAWMAPGAYGVDATGTGYWGCTGDARTPDNRGGSFQAINCRGGQAGIAEYGLGQPNGPIVIIYCAHELVRRLVETPWMCGPSSAAQPVTVVGARCSFDKLANDNFGILLRHGGPLFIQGGGLGEGAPRPVRIYHAGLGGLSTVVEGVSFNALGADKVYPVVQERVGQVQATAPRVLRTKGNLYRDRNGSDWTVAAFEREEVVEGVRGW